MSISSVVGSSSEGRTRERGVGLIGLEIDAEMQHRQLFDTQLSLHAFIDRAKTVEILPSRE